MVTTSSFNWDSQLSSSEAISSASRSFCSGVSFSIHFALSNFGKGATDSAEDGATAAEVKIDAVVAAVVEMVDNCEASSGTVAGEEGTVEGAVDAAVAAGFAVLEGEEKKEVMLALALGFLAEEVAMSPALRLRGAAMARANSRRN